MISYCINYFNDKEINHQNNIKPIIRNLLCASKNLNYEILWNNDSSSDIEIFEELNLFKAVSLSAALSLESSFQTFTPNSDR